MSEQHPTKAEGERDDDLHVELSDTSASSPSARHAAPASPFVSRLTRRGRLVRASGIAGAVLLALLVVLGSFPTARNAAGAWLARLHRTPTATPFVTYNRFYLLPNPPGTTVLLDGTALTRLPYPGDPHPLALAFGTHTFRWLSNAFPFPPLSCQLTVPAATSDTCTILAPYRVQPNPPADGSAPLSAPTIATHFSLATLAPDQASALTGAINAALDGLTATATIQPGDHYFTGNPGLAETSTSPLQVTLNVQPVPQPLAGPCDFIVPAHPCYFLGQDCAVLCTYLGAFPGAAVTYNGIDPMWIAGQFVQMTLRDTASNGTVPRQGLVPSDYGIQVALLGIIWDGTNWHALPLLGHRADLPPSDDLVCDPAFEAFGQGPVSYLFYPDASYDVTLTYASSPNPTDGCAVRLAGNPHAAEPAIPGNGTALFYERLGVLLAANDAAHQLWPTLPQADAAERALAKHLAAQAG
ncbi:MAG TPA: hypothetical protein VIG30_09505 [Ktedonobacterales bacterium]